MRRVLLLVLAILALASADASAQAPDTSLTKWMQLDLAVPEAPAMHLVGGDISSVVRPGTIHKLAASFEDFGGESGFRLPASFGLEVAPMLFRTRFSAQDYQRIAPLARLRVSIAAHRGDEEGSATGIALGLRTSIHNGADLRTHPRYRSEIESFLSSIVSLEQAVRGAGRVQCPVGVIPPCPGKEVAVLSADSAAKVVAAARARQKVLADSLETVRQAYVDSLWNAPMLDIAAGTSQTTVDSTGRDPSPERHSIWLSYANPLNTRTLQLVLGTQLLWEDEENWAPTLGGGARLYVGRSQIKGFIEGGLGGAEDRRLQVGGGGELKLFRGIYAQLSAGWEEAENGQERLRARFNLRTAPENTAK
jgi:hypothetical protein